MSAIDDIIAQLQADHDSAVKAKNTSAAITATARIADLVLARANEVQSTPDAFTEIRRVIVYPAFTAADRELAAKILALIGEEVELREPES